MDNSNTQQPAQTPVPTNTQPTPPAQPAAPQVPVATPASGNSNKLIIWIVVGLVVVALLSAGIYMFLGSKQPEETPTQPIVEATIKPQDIVDALDRDLSAVNVEDIESDFSSVDQDLQQL